MNALDSYWAADGADYRSFPSYPGAWENVEMAWLRRAFEVPQGWDGLRVVLHFEAVAGECEVRVNGKVVARHFDKLLPFDVDVTDAVRRDGPNKLLVGVRSPRFFDLPGRFGSRTYPTGAWWTGQGHAADDRIRGIWQDVFVQPSLTENRLRADIELRNDTT